MAELAELDRLEKQLEKALAEIDRLTSINAIKDCIYNVARGSDRIDGALLRSAFHDDAVVHYGKLYDGPVAGWKESSLVHQATQSQRQHLVGNIIVRLDGDKATTESYGIDRHKTPMNGEVLDLVLASRVLDRFERRDGEWRIVERTKIMDWGRAISADDGLYQRSPLVRGADDDSDLSYQLLA